MRLTADGVYGRIMDVGYDKGELSTGVPTFRGLFRIRVVKVDGDSIIGGCVGVSERE